MSRNSKPARMDNGWGRDYAFQTSGRTKILNPYEEQSEVYSILPEVRENLNLECQFIADQEVLSEEGLSEEIFEAYNCKTPVLFDILFGVRFREDIC